MGLLDDIAAGRYAGQDPAPQGPSGGFLDQIASGAYLDQPPPPFGAPEGSEALPGALPEQELGFGQKAAQVAATGARVLFPIVGGLAGAGTGPGALAALAAGGAAGEFTGQAIERAAGLRPEGFQALPMVGEAALGAAMGPISSLRRAAQAGKAVSSLGRLGSRVPGLAAGAAEGALVGAGAQTVSSLTREGRLPTGGELALGVGTGGALGGGLGALQRPAGQAAKAAPAAGAEAPQASTLGQPRDDRFVTPELFPGIRPPEGPIPQFSPTMSGEESTGLFERMARTAGRGTPGISIEPDPTGIPGFVNVVKRDADGNPIGALEIIAQVDETGALTGGIENVNIAVAPTRAAAGSAREILLTALKAGLLPPEYAARAGAMGQTPSGARFANRFAQELEGALTGPPKPAGLGAGGAKPASVLGLEADLQKTEKAIRKIIRARDKGRFSPEAAAELKRLRAERSSLSERLKKEKLFPAGVVGDVPPVSLEDIQAATARDQAIRARAGTTTPAFEEITPEVRKATLGDIRAAVARGEPIREAVQKTAAFQAGLRNGRVVNELLSTGQIDTPTADILLSRHGLVGFAKDLQDDRWAEGLSAAGKTLNVESQLTKLFKDIAESQVLNEEVETASRFGLVNTINDLFQLRRAGLVVPFPTAVRNAVGQLGRNIVETYDDWVTGLLGDPVAGTRARAAFQNLAAPRESTGRVRLLQEEFSEFGKQLTRFHATEGPQRGVLFRGTLNLDREKTIQNLQVFNGFLNTKLDDFGRRFRADAFLQGEMERLGLLKQYLQDPTGTLKSLNPIRSANILAKAAHSAAETSFAEAPQHVFKFWSEVVERAPVLTLVTPFPRFMGSAFSFIARHNPAGLLRAYAPQNANSPEALKKIYAQALSGTAMLAAGLALKSSYFAGDKPFEVRDPESGRVWDVRSYAPLTFHVALAHTILNLASGQKLGEIPFEDVREAMLGMGRFSDAVPAMAQIAIGQGDVKGFGEMLQSIAGDFLGGFARPGIAFRDTLEGLYKYERSVDKRATAKGRVLGGFASQVPFGGELFDIPPVINPATGKDVAETRPVEFFGQKIPASIFRHLSGLNVKDRTAVESELIKLRIDPFKRVQRTRLGDDQLEGVELATARERNLARTLMGPLLAARLFPRLQSLQVFPEDERRRVVDGIVTKAARDARARAKLMFRQQDPQGALTIAGSGPDRTRKQAAKRDAARRALVSRFGVE